MPVSYQERLEKLGNLRFQTGAEVSKLISRKVAVDVQRMLGNLADNYPEAGNTRIAMLYRAFSEERERALQSLMSIYNDQFFKETRPSYLFQILGDLLFISEKVGGVDYNDSSYREFLLKVHKAYFGGSRLANINESLESILGVPVQVRELYLEARRNGSPASTYDANRLVADILMDGNRDPALSVLMRDICYFISLIRPAHTLFDTRLVWTEEYNVTGCPSYTFGSDINGNVWDYDFLPTPNPIYSINKIAIAMTPSESEGLIDDSWIAGTVQDLDFSDTKVGILTLTDGTELIVHSLSYAYQKIDGSVCRVEMSVIRDGASIYFKGDKAPGSFIFSSNQLPPDIAENEYRQYDPLVIASTSFQSSVQIKRGADSHNIKRHSHGSCDGKVLSIDYGSNLYPVYEDIRVNCEFPDVELRDAKGTIPRDGIPDTESGLYLLEGSDLFISEDARVIKVKRSPLIARNGISVAGKEDVTVFVNGQIVDVISVDPWESRIQLSEAIPPGASVKVMYSWQNIYPAQVSESFPGVELPTEDIAGGDTFQNLAATVKVLAADSSEYEVHLQWPFVPEDLSLYGNASTLQVNEYPILSKEGMLATPEDIDVYLETSGGLQEKVANPITKIRSLLGHVYLSFTPPPGVNIVLVFHYTSSYRKYPFLFDSDQHLADMSGNLITNYSLVPDPISKEGTSFVTSSIMGSNTFYLKISEYTPEEWEGLIPSDLEVSVDGSVEDAAGEIYRVTSINKNTGEIVITPEVDTLTQSVEVLNRERERANQDKNYKPLEVSYRWRAFNLSHSSVIASDKTFRVGPVLNKDEKAGEQGAVAFASGSHNKVGSNQVHFSAEYLGDTDKYLELNDKYLESLPSGVSSAVTVLRKGTPPFHQTFTSKSFNISEMNAFLEEEPPYPGMIDFLHTDKFQEKGRVRLYSGLYEVTSEEGDSSIVMTPFCDSRGFDLSFTVKDAYWPNREYRSNNYRDFRKTEILSSARGEMQVLPENAKVRSTSFDWGTCRKGSIIYIESPLGTIESTVIRIIDKNTAVLGDTLFLPEGTYSFEIQEQESEQHGVFLNRVTRAKNSFDVSPVVSGIYPNGKTEEWTESLLFPDPDKDPYPRSSLAIMESGEKKVPSSEIDDSWGSENFQQDMQAAEKLVKFRNWDQEIMVLSLGLHHDVIEVPYDDAADKVKVLFWSVKQRKKVWYSFRGLVLMTREYISQVKVSDRPNGVIRLENEHDLDGLDGETFLLYRLIVRQVLEDNTVELVTLDELVRG